LTLGAHTVSSHDLSEIIRARVEELIRLIVMELPEKDYSNFIPSGLVLTAAAPTWAVWPNCLMTSSGSP